MGKTYAFILGRHPALSVAELIRAVPGIAVDAVAGGVCIAECAELPDGFIDTVGGTVKIAETVARFGSVAEVNAEVLRTWLPPRDGRMIFGLSVYGAMTGNERRQLYMEGLALKKLLKEEGRRARYVVSRETQLSSVVVTKNKLIEEGAEFVVVVEPRSKNHESRIVLGRTIAVQKFEAYGERDFDRPGRSAKRGMLPPKLAQMMINIAHGDRNLPLLDPFCGSGTVLGEALLMGYTQVVGADIQPEAVADTTAYLTWLEKKHPEFRGRWKVLLTDARELGKHLAAKSVGCIVAEPFLGPPQTGRENPAALKRLLAQELTPLYRGALAVFATLLAPGGAAVMALPVFGKGTSVLQVPIEEVRGSLALESLTEDVRTAVYERPDQRVGREIVLLRRPARG